MSWSIKARSLEEAARLRDLGNDRSILILIGVQVGIYVYVFVLLIEHRMIYSFVQIA